MKTGAAHDTCPPRPTSPSRESSSLEQSPYIAPPQFKYHTGTVETCSICSGRFCGVNIMLGGTSWHTYSHCVDPSMVRALKVPLLSGLPYSSFAFSSSAPAKFICVHQHCMSIGREFQPKFHVGIVEACSGCSGLFCGVNIKLGGTSWHTYSHCVDSPMTQELETTLLRGLPCSSFAFSSFAPAEFVCIHNCNATYINIGRT